MRSSDARADASFWCSPSTFTSASSARSRLPRSFSKLAASRSSTSRRTDAGWSGEVAPVIVVTYASHWWVARARRSSSSSACSDDGSSFTASAHQPNAAT